METLGTGGRVALAIGVAGSGKTTLLKPLVKAWEDDGRTVYGIALAWRQSSDLAAAGIQKDRTRAVDSFLNALSKEKISLDSNAVVVVDEVGLLGTRQLNQILLAQKKVNFQIVLIGDPKQMQAIEAGPVISLLRQALGDKAVPELGTSVRQNDIDDRETTLMFRNGETAAAIERKFANGTLQIAPGGYRDAINHVAELWKQRKIENADRPGYIMSISAPTNAEAHEISLAIRDVRRSMGEVGADKLIVSATDGTASRVYQMALAEGDNVRLFKRINATFSDTGRSSNIGQNGSVLKIAQIGDDGLVLETPLGKTGFVPWSRLKTDDGRVQLAYGDALTTNTAQGSTVSEHIHAMPSGTSQVTAFGAYVSGSRHREQSFIVTSEGAERSEIADRRPLGDRRPVSQRDILDNMARNLARQPEKESALALIAKASELRRGTIQTVQKTLQPLERREAADELKTQLRERSMTRRMTQQLRSRLPGLSETLRRQGERLNQVTRVGAAMAQRVVTAARKRTSNKTTDRGYWKSVADQAKDPTLSEDQKQTKRRTRSR
jgi:molybdopterin-guanine dinucleotide biosynthesis protein